jgi:hypothetical protein
MKRLTSCFVLPAVLLSVAALLFFNGCTKTSVVEAEPKVIEIFRPAKGGSYTDTVTIVVRVDLDKAPGSSWNYFYSIDEKVWKQIEDYVLIENRAGSDTRANFLTQIIRWPAKAQQVTGSVFVKVTPYGSSPYSDKVGPFTIE